MNLWRFLFGPRRWRVVVSFGPGETFATEYEGSKREAEDVARLFVGARVMKTGQMTWAKYCVERL